MIKKKKQKSLPYDQSLTIILKYFEILLTDTDKNPHSKAMEINSRTLNKMGYVLTDNNAWVFKDQVGAHVEEKHDEVKE